MSASSVQQVESAVSQAANALYMTHSEAALARVRTILLEQMADRSVELDDLRQEAMRLLLVED